MTPLPKHAGRGRPFVREHRVGYMPVTEPCSVQLYTSHEETAHRRGKLWPFCVQGLLETDF